VSKGASSGEEMSGKGDLVQGHQIKNNALHGAGRWGEKSIKGEGASEETNAINWSHGPGKNGRGATSKDAIGESNGEQCSDEAKKTA